MDSATIERRYFDPAINSDLASITSQFAKAFGYTAEGLLVEPGLAQLIRLRVAQINHCVFCMDLHAQAARNLKIDQSKIDTLGAWWETDLYTDKERAALSYTEVLTRQSVYSAAAPFKDTHEELSRYFSIEEVVEIAALIINMNVWTRLKTASGEIPVRDR